MKELTESQVRVATMLHMQRQDLFNGLHRITQDINEIANAFAIANGGEEGNYYFKQESADSPLTLVKAETATAGGLPETEETKTE